MNAEAYREMARVQDEHWWFSGRREILREQLKSLSLPRDAAILEVGSGTGANLRLLSEFGEVTGLEMSCEAVSLAQTSARNQGLSITLLTGRCPDALTGITKRFDLICLFDVLEHIEADTESLAALVRLLKPEGRLVLTVPAYRWLWGPHDVNCHHVRRYSAHSLERACADAGVSLARLSYFNTVLFPLAVAGRMFEKLSGRRSGATQTPSAPINKLLAFVFALERHLLKSVRLPFGLSLFAVAMPAPARG